MHRSLGFSSSGGGGGGGGSSNALATSTGGGLQSGLAGGLQRGKTTVPPLGKVKAPRGGKLAPLGNTLRVLTDEQKEAARFQFDAYDANSNGKLDKDELKNLLGELGLKMDGTVFDAYVQQQFNQFDKDFSGDLDFDEFLGFYSVIIFEQKKQGFSFSKWQKHNTPR